MWILITLSSTGVTPWGDPVWRDKHWHHGHNIFTASMSVSLLSLIVLNIKWVFVQKLIYIKAMCISTVALLILEFNEIEPALNLTCVWSHNLLFCVCHGKVVGQWLGLLHCPTTVLTRENNHLILHSVSPHVLGYAHKLPLSLIWFLLLTVLCTMKTQKGVN